MENARSLNRAKRSPIATDAPSPRAFIASMSLATQPAAEKAMGPVLPARRSIPWPNERNPMSSGWIQIHARAGSATASGRPTRP